MSRAWFAAPYKRRDRQDGRPGRYCAMDDFTAQIEADGGAWSETEVLGNYALVKVRASDATLTTIAQAQGFHRLPAKLLHETLADLTAAQKQRLHDFILSLGYTDAELREAFPGDLGNYTLGDVLRFIARRRLLPRYDAGTDTIVCDGPEQPVRPIDHVDLAVR